MPAPALGSSHRAAGGNAPIERIPRFGVRSAYSEDFVAAATLGDADASVLGLPVLRLSAPDVSAVGFAPSAAAFSVEELELELEFDTDFAP